jgi:hypothetical protein
MAEHSGDGSAALSVKSASESHFRTLMSSPAPTSLWASAAAVQPR